MTTFATQLRDLTRHWPLLTLLPVAALAAWLMLPVNADAYLTLIYNDPQGAEQNLDAFRTDARGVYTSGLGWAALLALAAGAYLGRGATTRTLLPRAAGAAIFGLALAVAAILTALPAAAGRLAHHWAVAMLAQDRAPAPTTGPLWPTVLAAVACVALAGAIGAGLGAGARRGWAPGIFIGLLGTGMTGYLALAQLPENSALILVIAALAIIPLTVAYLWISGYALAAAGALLVTAALTLALARQNVARRS